MWSRHQLANELFVVLLRGNGMLGKNALAGGGQCFAALITVLVSVCIGMGSSGIGAHVLAADRAAGRAIIGEGVTDAINCCIAVLAGSGATVLAYVATVGVRCTTVAAGSGAKRCVCMRIVGTLTADIADGAALGCGSYVIGGCRSLFAADVTGSIAITVIGVSDRLSSRNGDTAVTANGSAYCYRLVRSSNSVTGGASGFVTGSIACAIVLVSGNCLSAVRNLADTVAILRIVIVAGVIANGLANVTVMVLVGIHVICRFGHTAGIALLCVAGAFPNVLLISLEATAVIAGLVTSSRISMCVVGSRVVARTAGAAASELVIVLARSNRSCLVAVDAGNGALILILVLCRTGRTAVLTFGGAGMSPGVRQRFSGSHLFLADGTLRGAGVGKGVLHVGSLHAANRAGGRARGCIGVL